MKIAVCDDFSNDRKAICENIRAYAKKNFFDIEIEQFSSGEELLNSFSNNTFHIVFIDIYMEGISGVETAFKIREQSKKTMIIFVTTSKEFFAEGFEVGAVHYLIKPADYQGVETALNRCSNIFIEAEKYFEVTVDRKLVKVRTKDVLYAEVYGKTVVVHTISGELKTYTTLSEMLNLLESGSFLFCHRCYIVNMRYVSELLDSDFLLENGEMIPIRKNGKQKIKDEYINYIFNSVRNREELGSL